MRSIVAACITVVLCVPLTVAAQEPPAAGEPAGQAEPYQPSLSDIMGHQQERHIKLWFAGNAGNWPLADYEIGELEDGFEDVGNRLGGDIVKQHVGAALEALHKAVDAKNRAAFTSAFDMLNAGCNACHHALDHSFIAITRPSSLPYSDQSFAPQK